MLRQSAEFEGGVGEDVYRIGADEQDALKVSLSDLRDDALENIYIFMDQV